MAPKQDEQQFDHGEPKRFVYFDTNIISWVSRAEVENFFSSMQRAGVGLVISDITVSELQAGISSGELQLLLKQGFFQIMAHEALFEDRPFALYRPASIGAFVGKPDGTTEADVLEDFLIDLFRSASGSRSVAHINELFVDGLSSILDELAKDLPEGTNPRIVASFEAARKQVSTALEKLPALPHPLISKAEADGYRFGPRHFGYLKPPGIVRQIVDIFPPSESQDVSAFVDPIKPEENIRARVQNLCLGLTLAGFGRDGRVGKDSEKKSLVGAQAQFKDFYHIAAAAGLDAFFTSDAKASRLAYAVYEHFNLRTMVVHVARQSSLAVATPVSPDYWP